MSMNFCTNNFHSLFSVAIKLLSRSCFLLLSKKVVSVITSMLQLSSMTPFEHENSNILKCRQHYRLADMTDFYMRAYVALSMWNFPTDFSTKVMMKREVMCKKDRKSHLQNQSAACVSKTCIFCPQNQMKFEQSRSKRTLNVLQYVLEDEIRF